MRELACCWVGALVVAVLGCDARSAALGSQLPGQAGTGQTGVGQAGMGSSAAGSAGTTGNADPTSGAVAAPHGGSRLKARIAEAASGAFQILGWQDTELDVACDFQPSPSGALSCIPTGDDLVQVASAEVSLYGDARCSTPVRELQFGSVRCAPPRFAAQWSAGDDVDPCQGELSYFRVGTGVSQVYRKVGDACESVVYPAPANSISRGFFEVEPLALEQFVAGTLREGAAANGIRPVYVTTPDGAEGFLSFRDAEQGFDCGLLTLGDGLRCGPTNAPTLTGLHFSDDGCQVPAAMAFTCQQGAGESVPFVLEAAPYDDPEAGWRVYEGGARLATSYSGTDGDCAETQGTLGIFAVGDEIPSSSFVPGAREEATDALGLMTVTDRAGGWRAPTGGALHNTDFEGYDCTYFPTKDGVVRCVPSPSFFSMEYADADCSESLIGGWGSGPIVAFASEQCPRQASVFAIAEEYSGPIYRKDGEQCVFDREQPPQPSRTIAHRLGAEVPADRFPAMPIRLR